MSAKLKRKIAWVVIAGVAVWFALASARVFAQVCTIRPMCSLAACDGVTVCWFTQTPQSQITGFTLKTFVGDFSLPATARQFKIPTTCNSGGSVTYIEHHVGGTTCQTTDGFPHAKACNLCGSSSAGTISVVNAASFSIALTPNSIAAAFPSQPATNVVQTATTFPLPLDLRGVRVTIDDQAVPLFYVSPDQVNFHIPEWVTPGTHTVQLYGSDGIAPNGRIFSNYQVPIIDNAPALFTFGNSGSGDAAAVYLPIGALTYVSVFGTGVNVKIDPRDGTNTGTVKLTLGNGQTYDALYSGPAFPFIGLWQGNFAIPASVLPAGRAIGAFLRVCDLNGRCWQSQGVQLRR